MKRLETCCCCWSVKVASVLTGILGILLSIATILIIFLAEVEFKTFVLDWLPKWVVSAILVINLCMTILISALMIYGAIKRKSWFMLPWVALGIVLSVGLLVSVLYTSISLYLDEEDHVIMASVILVVGIIYFILFLYAWAAVFSHFLNVKDEEDRGRYMKAPYRR